MEFENYEDVIDAFERDNMGYDTLTDYIRGQNIKLKGISLDEAGTDSTFLGDEPPKRSGIMETDEAKMMMAEAPMAAGADDRDPFLVEEYEKYIFDMMEQGLQPMSFEEFRREAMAGMAKAQPKEIEEIKEKKVISLAGGGISELLEA
jgi:hypothetical protein